MKRTGQSDHQEGYSGVRQQQGQVQTDSDWNPINGPPRWVMWAIGGGLLVAIAGLVIAIVSMPVATAVRETRQPPMVVSLVFPEDLDTVPLLSTLWVRAEIAGRSKATELTLVVNGQTWATTELSSTDRGASWGWTPSGEGEHQLTVVARDSQGNTYASATATVYASSRADFRFPREYTVVEGDTYASLADTYSSSEEEIRDANPNLGPSESLTPGDEITIPVHVPTGPGAAPQADGPAAPPVGPLPSAPPTAIPPISDGTAFGDAIVALGSLPVPPGFTIKNGVLIPSQPVDRVYLYYAVGEDEWQRVPEDPDAFIPVKFEVFDLRPYFDFSTLDSLPEPVLLKVEAWGWAGDTLVPLGSYSGYYGAGQAHWPYGGTDLQVYSHQTLGKKYYATKAEISGDASDWSLQFRWASQSPGVTGAMWQVSEKPFPSTLDLNPPGLIHSGVDNGNPGGFTLDFRDYFISPKSSSFFGQLSGGLGDLLSGALDAATGQQPPNKQFWPFLTRTFYVRVVPLGGDSTAEPSNWVVVHFTPSGQPVPISGPLNGPVYEARIIGFDPFVPPDPDYSTCWVMNKDFQSCTTDSSGQQHCSIVVPKGTPGCGCPGVSCSSSGSSCSLSPTDWGDCASEGLQKVGSWLKKGWDALAGVYNDAVAFVKKMVAELNPFCIQAKMAAAEFGGETVTEDDVQGVCEAVADVAVTAVMSYFGLPPSLPEFDQLMNEGLDYAIGIAASEMGIDCNKQCRDLLKDGFQAAASGENLFERGLDLGVSMAADKLNDLGYQCDASCKQLIQEGVQGKASFGQLTETAANQATQEIVANINASGGPFYCDQTCADVIHQQIKQGAAIGDIAKQAAASQAFEPWMVPHPLAAEQPAIVRVEVFRRWESAEVPDSELERCGLSVDNLVTNDVRGQIMSARLFEPIGLDIPVLDPGERMVIPVLLERSDIPADVMSAMNPGGANLTLPGLGDVTDLAGWFNFYSQGQIGIRTWGPLFLSSASDKPVACVDEVNSSFALPNVGFNVGFP
jgi:hypothetical protein